MNYRIHWAYFASCMVIWITWSLFIFIIYLFNEEAPWRKRLDARLPQLGSRVLVSVTPCGFCGGRNGVIPPFLHTHLIHFLFHKPLWWCERSGRPASFLFTDIQYRGIFALRRFFIYWPSCTLINITIHRRINMVLTDNIYVSNDIWRQMQAYLNFSENRTHYTISQSTVWYDKKMDQWQPNYTDSFPFSKLKTHSFLATFICFQISRADDSAFFFICAGFVSNRIGRVYVHSTNMAKADFLS